MIKINYLKILKMSLTFDILNITQEKLNESEILLLITFFFECKEKNSSW